MIITLKRMVVKSICTSFRRYKYYHTHTGIQKQSNNYYSKWLSSGQTVKNLSQHRFGVLVAASEVSRFLSSRRISATSRKLKKYSRRSFLGTRQMVNMDTRGVKFCSPLLTHPGCYPFNKITCQPMDSTWHIKLLWNLDHSAEEIYIPIQLI